MECNLGLIIGVLRVYSGNATAMQYKTDKSSL